MSTALDIEPYASAAPCCMSTLTEEDPLINYPNPQLMIKVLLFVGGGYYYHEITATEGSHVDPCYYYPPKSSTTPAIPRNSLIEICGTIEDIQKRNYDKIVHRIISTGIYHHTPHNRLTNPPSQAQNTTTTATTPSTTPHVNRQWTNDDVMLALNKHALAARQYYTQAQLTHNARDEYICWYDVIPYNAPRSTEYFAPTYQYAGMWGTLAIISSISLNTSEEETTIHFLIPTTTTTTTTTTTSTVPPPQWQNDDGDAQPAHQFSFRAHELVVSIGFLGALPTIGSLCIIYHDEQPRYSGYFPLLLPQTIQPTVSSSPEQTIFTQEMFATSVFMTSPFYNEALYQLATHHDKLSTNITNKEYSENNMPPREECIDIGVYLDIVEPVAAEAKQEQERQQKALAEKAKLEEEEKQRQEQYQQHLQQLQIDKAFILQQLQYHNDVIITPTVQKLQDHIELQQQEQHPNLSSAALSSYITTHITTPFQQLQQYLRDYLDNNYHSPTSEQDGNEEKNNNDDGDDSEQRLMSENKMLDGDDLGVTIATTTTTDATPSRYNINNPQPSPLESYEYNAYCNDFQDIQTTLCALSSATTLTTASLLDSFLLANNNNTNPSTSSSPFLLQLQPPHIHHHAHPCNAERARTAQRVQQHILKTAITTTPPPTTTIQPPFLSTTNTSLHHMIESCEVALTQQQLSSTGALPQQTPHYHQPLLLHPNDRMLKHFEQREQQLLILNEALHDIINKQEQTHREELQTKDNHHQQQLKEKDKQFELLLKQLEAKDKQLLAYQQHTNNQ